MVVFAVHGNGRIVAQLAKMSRTNLPTSAKQHYKSISSPPSRPTVAQLSAWKQIYCSSWIPWLILVLTVDELIGAGSFTVSFFCENKIMRSFQAAFYPWKAMTSCSWLVNGSFVRKVAFVLTKMQQRNEPPSINRPRAVNCERNTYLTIPALGNLSGLAPLRLAREKNTDPDYQRTRNSNPFCQGPLTTTHHTIH